MSKLVTLNGSNDQELLSSIFDNEIVVFEDIQGSKIWVNWDGKEFTIKPKSIGSESINLIDLAMQNYYNPAIKFFESLDIRVKSLLNRKWWFCFEYFPDNQPANIEYSRVPKNNLVLTALNKSGKYDFSIEELDEYARLFDVDILPIVFQGKLTERMVEAIKYFINTSEDDLEYIFGEKSFAFFFYKILNPSSQNSFLMEDEDYQSNLEKLIVRTKKGDLSFEILNPLYKRISDNNSTDFVEIYTLILVNFLNFCQSFNLDEVKLKGSKRDEIYIYLISKLFNVYISEVKQDLLDFDFTVPEFFDKEKFKINTELISNKLTKDYIKESDKLEYIFKVILGSFSKKRKKPIGVFDSGYGGLTILSSLREKMPQYDFIYFGDNARAPYGNRSFDVVYSYTLAAVEFLFSQGCNLIIIACNTSSAKALRTIQQNDLHRFGPNKRVLGVIRPSTEQIGDLTKTNCVGILGTLGTINSSSYPIELAKFAPDIEVHQHACPMWVPLIENQQYEHPAGKQFILEDVQQLLSKNEQIDTILLACTHYPVLQEQLQQLVGPNIQIVPQGPIVAEKLAAYLDAHPEMEQRLSKNGEVGFFTSETPVVFNQKASHFFGQKVEAEHHSF